MECADNAKNGRKKLAHVSKVSKLKNSFPKVDISAHTVCIEELVEEKAGMIAGRDNGLG